MSILHIFDSRNKFFYYVSFVVIAIGLMIFLLSRNVHRSVYRERQEMLTLVTSNSATVMSEIVVEQRHAREVAAGVVREKISGSRDVFEGIRKAEGELEMGVDYFFLVDAEGKYYSSDGVEGKLTDRTRYLDSSPDTEEYLSSLPHLDQTTPFLLLKQRLDEPVSALTSQGVKEIRYFVYAHDFTRILDTLSDLFPGEVNIFLHDSDGAMIFRHFGIKLLVEGFNIYSKMRVVDFTFGEDAEDLIASSRAGNIIAVRMNIGSQGYYFCSAPMDVSDWSIAFVVKEEYLSDLADKSFADIVLYLAVIAAILALSLILLITNVMKRKAEEVRLKESEKLAAAMSEASKAKTDFLSNMSHDIRTPINGIMGMTEIALGAGDDSDKVRSCLQKIDGASRHLLSLINDVLDMSRIESGKTLISAAPTDVKILGDSCASIIRGQMADRDIDFNVEVNGEHTAVLADELHLRQIFINILGNAVKFTRDGGRIDFICTEESCDERTAAWKFVCRDTGIGMSDEFIEHIFEPFSQEKGGGRTHYKGTGLGMSITKQLVDLMGGVIEVESELEKGSTFTVRMTFERDLQVHSRSEDTVECATIEGMHILLVEDNELNTEIATELLQCNGAVVDTAADGAEAVEKFSAGAPGTYDVILMDIMMPVMNGLDAARTIRSLDRPDAALIPIIAMTANAFDDDVKATREAGMNAHLSKPIDIDEVVRVIAYNVKR